MLLCHSYNYACLLSIDTASLELLPSQQVPQYEENTSSIATKSTSNGASAHKLEKQPEMILERSDLPQSGI